MNNREMIQQQINDLQQKATQRPGEQDDMGMVGFMSVLLAAKMQTMLLQADEEQRQEGETRGRE